MKTSLFEAWMEDTQAQAAVRGSPTLPLNAYGYAVVVVIDGVAGLFASNNPGHSKEQIVEHLLKIINDNAGQGLTSGTTHPLQ